MENVTKETRRESYTEVKKDLSERQKLTYLMLHEFKEGATAKELSLHMYEMKLVPSPERNSVHPRLNELIEKGLIEVTGKKICSYTNRKVAIYKCK